MTITEKYLKRIIAYLEASEITYYRDGFGYKFACPFCSGLQKRDGKANEKCAYIYPVTGSFTYFFSCKRGMNKGRGNHACSKRMRFETFLKEWNPYLWKQFKKEKERT